MQKQYLETGKIVTTQALKGEVKVIPWCDSPEMLCEFDTLYIKKSGEYVPINIQRARVQKNMCVLKIEGTDTVEDAQKLVNTILYMDRDDVELDEDTYFIQDLIGLSVYDVDTAELYGTIDDVLQTGANDVYSIKKDGKERLVPAIADVVIETDIENKKMTIRPLKGLFYDDEV